MHVFCFVLFLYKINVYSVFIHSKITRIIPPSILTILIVKFVLDNSINADNFSMYKHNGANILQTS